MASKYEWTCPKCSQTFTGDDSDALEDRAWDHLERVHKDDSVLVKIKRSAANDAEYHTVHEFQPGQATTKWDPIVRKKVVSENPNFCKVCGRKKDHVLHAKDRRAAAHRALDAVLDARAPFLENRAMSDLAIKVQSIWRAMPNTEEGVAAAKEKMRAAIAASGSTPEKLADYVTKMATSQGRRLNVNHIKGLARDDDQDKERRKKAALAGFGWIPTWDLEAFAKAVGLSTNLKNNELRDLLAERGYTPGDLIRKLGPGPSKRPKGTDMRTQPSKLTNACPYCDADHDPAIQCRLMPVSPRGQLNPSKPAKDAGAFKPGDRVEIITGEYYGAKGTLVKLLSPNSNGGSWKVKTDAGPTIYLWATSLVPYKSAKRA